jgi:hypothetical protein
MSLPPITHWTCSGKGGAYELLGSALGAGTSRDAEALLVYRDIHSGVLYYRTVADFIARMAPLPTPVRASP